MSWKIHDIIGGASIWLCCTRRKIRSLQYRCCRALDIVSVIAKLAMMRPEEARNVGPSFPGLPRQHRLHRCAPHFPLLQYIEFAVCVGRINVHRIRHESCPFIVLRPSNVCCYHLPRSGLAFFSRVLLRHLIASRCALSKWLKANVGVLVSRR